MPISIDQIISLLDLKSLPGEGGRYAETYRSPDRLAGNALPNRYNGREKFASTAIYYLLTDEADSFSALHRLPTDELYHFYLGDPVEMLLLQDDGASEIVHLGHDLEAGQRVQFLVPAGTWQGSRLLPGGKYALMGTTMAPGFDFMDYEGGEREKLLADYPMAREQIQELTRG